MAAAPKLNKKRQKVTAAIEPESLFPVKNEGIAHH
jgi:hypothetical protein